MTTMPDEQIAEADNLQTRLAQSRLQAITEDDEEADYDDPIIAEALEEVLGGDLDQDGELEVLRNYNPRGREQFTHHQTMGQRGNPWDPNGRALMNMAGAPAPTIVVYRTDTGEAVEIAKRSWPLRRLIRRQNGQLLFSRKPVEFTGITWHICMLHKDHPLRSLWNTKGFYTCPKSKIPSEHLVTLHMKSAHPDEYEAIQEYKAEIERKRVEARDDRQARALELLAENVQLNAELALPPHEHIYAPSAVPGDACEVPGCQHKKPDPNESS